MSEKMMQGSLEQFFQMASQDLELQEKLKAANDREAYIRLVVELGKEKGYSFTSSQVVTALDKAAKEAAENGEEASQLSEQELEAVAGGGVGELLMKGVKNLAENMVTNLRSCEKSTSLRSCKPGGL